jgi:copper chaperone CopZ
MDIKFKIRGMHCKGCANLIMLTMEDHGFSNIKIDAESGAGSVATDLTDISQAEKTLVEAFKELPDYELYGIEKTG